MTTATRNLQRFFSQYKIVALLLAIIIIWAFFGQITEGAFLTPRNFSNLLPQMAITGLLASGMVFVLIAGDIDLSVGSALGLLGGVTAVMQFTSQRPGPVTIVPVLALGSVIGLFVGFCAAYQRVPSFIVTLAG